jgi:hypothetical protein
MNGLQSEISHMDFDARLILNLGEPFSMVFPLSKMKGGLV